MTYESVENRRGKFRVSVIFSPAIHIDLFKAEQVKVVDQKSAEQHDSPPEQRNDEQDILTCGIINAPDNVGHGPPLPEEQNEREACQ